MTTTTMRKTFSSAALLIAGGLVLFIFLRPASARANLNVVATVPDLAALAKEVGGNHVAVKAIALPTQDPHFVDAKPSLVLDLNRANLLLSIGLQLEVGWLPVLITNARNAAIQPGGPGHLECASLVRLLNVPTGPVDRSMGDVHPGGNPHFLYDPRAAAAVAKGIAARMGELDPAHGAAYQANLTSFLRRLDTARRDWEKRLAPHRGAAIVGYHRTLVYLADWLGLVEIAFLEPKPGVPPNPAHVANVIAVARGRGAKALVQESYYPDATAKFVAQKVPLPLVKLQGGTDVQRGQSYLDHLGQNLSTLEAAFRGGRK